jgi:hypothetical protein
MAGRMLEDLTQGIPMPTVKMRWFRRGHMPTLSCARCPMSGWMPRVQPGKPKIRDIGLLEAALARPQATAFGSDAYADLDAKAAAGTLDTVEDIAGPLATQPW